MKTSITKQVVVVACSLFLLFPSLLTADEIPIFTSVEFSVQQITVSSTGLFTYRYSLKNPPTNAAELGTVNIDITQPNDTLSLSSEGLVIMEGISRSGKLLQTTFDEEHGNIREKGLMDASVIPVGMKPPTNWHAALSTAGSVFWGNAGEQYHLLPGQSLDDFEITSYGLPGIRSVTVEPRYFLPPVYGGVKEEDFEQLKEIRKQITLVLKTIGPTAPPADFKATSFIDYIISMKHEAFSLGWITDKGIENSLDTKLDNAKKKLEQGNTDAAKNILEALVNELEAQKDKHLTSEAYGLLKYNVEYLIGRL